jgi:hypothetical protein
MKEAEFTRVVCFALKSAGAMCFVMAGGSTSSGLPDRLVIHAAWKGFIEFKSSGGTLRANQVVTMREAVRRGFPALVVEETRGTSQGWGLMLRGAPWSRLSLACMEPVEYLSREPDEDLQTFGLRLIEAFKSFR